VQSENRAEATRKMEKEEADAEDDDRLDEDDLAIFKDEIKEENELQCGLVEILGLLFKTHKLHCRPLVDKVLTEIIPKLSGTQDKAKQKFLLYILDDMIEYLGPDFLGEQIFHQIVGEVCKFAALPAAAIRQAACYGIGMAAQNGGAGFAGVSQLCLTSLSTAINYQADSKVKEKKQKMFKFQHARDNAVAAFGRVLRYQNTCIDAANLIADWVNFLPLEKDYIEAKFCNEFLAEETMKNSALILGPNNERLEKFIMILGEICDDEQSNENTLDRLAVIVANLFQNAQLSEPFKTISQSKLSQE
jgi:importin-5